MRTCKFCYKENTQALGWHEECLDQWHYRLNNGICVRCNGKSLPNDCWCDTCIFGSVYVGYPGGKI